MSETDLIRREASDWLIVLRESPEDTALRERFEVWRSADPAHAKAWDSMVTTFDVLGFATPEPATEQQSQPFKRRNARHPSSQRRPISSAGRISRKVVAGLAAACVLAFVVNAPAFYRQAIADFTTPVGQVRTVALEDGSQLHLGPDSAVRINYEADGRQVQLLSGSAWFDVARDPSRPFRIKSGDVTTTVLGTHFDVQRFGAEIAVSVQEGHVRVETGAVREELVAGQWLRIGGTDRLRRGQVQPELIGGWRTGEMIVRDRALSEAIQELRPWFKGRIVLADAELGRRRVTGIYDLNDPVGAVEGIADAHGGKVHRVTPWLIVISR
ncbi:MAG: FecR family protein [Asticcacaulis sp.]